MSVRNCEYYVMVKYMSFGVTLYKSELEAILKD